MKVSDTALPGVMIVEPRVFEDTRGLFLETWQQARYRAVGLPTDFVQDNLSRSAWGVLRGLHFQNPHAQGKLVYVLQGEVFDVAVDIRVGSPTFGQWVGVVLSGNNRHQLYIPEGFAHGFCVTSESALVAYKCTDFYASEAEGGVLWNDPDLAINWPIRTPLLSAKDAAYPMLSKIPLERLPPYQKQAAS
ncbi:MAG TPA: dTDP-4-dehydrorhamnose 3,5-epimerase [Candidatus Binatia bacterium]|nr:dTDP-4-dehydrorhamnose 3,5-epimerase [Candidatus Binatia bacterium]